MNNKKEKSACGAGTPTAEMKNTSTKILADSEVIVKCDVDISKLTHEQKSQILQKYAKSHNLNELFFELEQLKFCGVEIAAQALKAMGYLNNEDYCYLTWRYKSSKSFVRLEEE